MINIIFGVTGSISAYKAIDMSNWLSKNHNVDVVLTQSAQRFVTPLPFQTMTGNKVHTDLFDESNPSVVNHINLAGKAHAILIAPASANTIAKLANGMADNLLTSIVLATRAPIFLAPAMNTNMYLNPVTQENLDKLRKRGYIIIEPIEGKLACGVVGVGKIQKPTIIVDIIEKYLNENVEYSLTEKYIRANKNS